MGVWRPAARYGMIDWIKEWKSSAAEPSGVLSMNYDKCNY